MKKKRTWICFGLKSNTKYDPLTGKWITLKKTLYLLFIPIAVVIIRDIDEQG